MQMTSPTLIVAPSIIVGLIAAFLTGCNGTASNQNQPTPERTIPPPKIARSPAVAGRFYDKDPNTLRRRVQSFIDQSGESETKGRLVAAVVPHAGYVFSGVCAANIYGLVQELEYTRVIILGPSHYARFPGISLPAPDLTHYRTPMGDVEIDRTACASLATVAGFSIVPGVDTKEHSIEVQLPFLQETAKRFLLVPLLCGSIPSERTDHFAKAILNITDDKTLVLASSDFTHYGPNYRFIPFKEDPKKGLYEWLEQSTRLIASLDIKGFDQYCTSTRDTICGLVPVKVLMSMMTYRGDVHGYPLNYYTSGDIVGDYKNSVSYAAISFHAALEQKAPPRKSKRKRRK